jgi:GNAT superfamily N-acetyltransferase
VAEWVVEPLDRTHERSSFACGNSPLDDFLRQLVSHYEKRRLGRTYVALRPAEKRVVGYYTLASGAVSFASLPPAHGKKLPRHPVPVVLLARLAVAIEAQGRGLGQFLLVDALHRCHELSERLGVYAVEVEAVDDDARRFYEKYGFVALADDDHHLYLPIETIRKSFGRR